MKSPEQLNTILADMAARYTGGPDDEAQPPASGRMLVPAFRSGLHLGNDGAPGEPMLRWLLDARCQHLLAMDNVGPELLVPWANSAPDTVLVLRHHLPHGNRGLRGDMNEIHITPPDPSAAAGGPVSEAEVLNWANGAVEQIHRWLTANPVYLRMYEQRRVACKLFNEPNLEGQFGPNGDIATFDRYNDYFCLAAEFIKTRFPLVRVAGFSLAPGNYDAWFSGDPAGRHYWLHGPEAAKENPTPADIRAARASCRARDAIERMDDFGIHLYPLAGTWDKPWLGLRFTRYWRFLPARLRHNTLILEGTISDHGVDPAAYQRVRAEEEILHLQKLAEYDEAHPEGTIRGRTGWWGKRGDPTWRIHEYLDDGDNPRPVARAVKAFNEAAPLPPPPNPNPAPPPPPQGFEWGVAAEWLRVVRYDDSVLRVPYSADGKGSVLRIAYSVNGNDGDPPSTQYATRNTQHGTRNTQQGHWQLTRGRFEDAHESGGTQHIYIESPRGGVATVTDQSGRAYDVPLDKPDGEPAGNFPMWPGNLYAVSMGDASDRLEGCHLPLRQHVNYRLWFEWVNEEEPVETIEQKVLATVEGAQVLFLNPAAALQRAISRDGFVPTSPEKAFAHNGKSWVAQRAEHLATGRVRGYYCEAGQWERVLWVERGGSEPPAAPPAFAIDRRFTGRAALGKNYSRRPAAAAIKGIILHHTGGGFAGSLSHLTSPTSGVGAHYLIDSDGHIYQLVEDRDAAWHAGFSILNGLENCNDFTLGIELVNKGDGRAPYPPAQRAALLWLLRQKVREHAIQPGWIATHQAVRAAFRAKYPDRTGVHAKTDPAGLDVGALLADLFGRDQRSVIG